MRFFDWQAEWIIRHLTIKWIKRISAAMLDLSFLFFVYAPFSGEKQGVYQMSFVALLFAAIIALLDTKQLDDADSS